MTPLIWLPVPMKTRPGPLLSSTYATRLPNSRNALTFSRLASTRRKAIGELRFFLRLRTIVRRLDPPRHSAHGLLNGKDHRADRYPFLADAGSRPRNCSGMEEASGFAEFQQALERLGWTYGRNIQIDIPLE